MQEQILEEIKQLKEIMAKLVGTSTLAPEEQFSRSALDKASGEFRKLKLAKDEWIKEYDLYKYIRNAGNVTGKFIRTEFKFSRCIKNGYHYMYSKKDILA